MMIIYTYCHPDRQICFVLSELISVARQARFPKLGLKPVDSNANPRFYHSAIYLSFEPNDFIDIYDF